ncbi:hypothetical protein [Haladaptatus sp. NG-WS-4]
MKDFPPVPPVETAPPELFEGGHLWIQERIDGADVRFQLEQSGVIRFGDRERVFDVDEIPMGYRHVVRHVRESLDREAVRAAIDDVESVVFFGVATRRQRIDYEWNRLPSFLGTDVWSDVKGRYLPPDVVERIYTTLGLTPINTFEKETRAVDFDPDSYEIPRSTWYDGPAAGVVARNKTGQRALLRNPRFEGDDESTPVTDSPEALARRYVTNERIETVVAELERRNRPVTVETVYERVLEDVVRTEYTHLFDGAESVDLQAFQSEVAARTRRYVET